MLKESIPPLYKSNKLEIRLHVNSNHTHYGMPYASQSSMDMLAQMNAADYKEEIYYINNTYRNITVMGRNGLALSIPYVSSCTSRDFTIKKVIKLKGYSLTSAISSIQSLTDIDDAELQEIKNCLLTVDRNDYHGAAIMIDYPITIEDLKAKGNTLYHYQTDTVVSFSDTANMDIHPYSTRFLSIGTFGVTNEYGNQRELNLKIRYVNHSPNAGPIYLNLAGKVFTVYPQKDGPCKRITIRNPNGKNIVREYDDYVQLFYSSKCDPDAINADGVSAARMTLDEAKDKIGVYTSYTDALNSGNLELNRKEELLKLVHQVELLKQNSTLDKVKLEQEEFKRKEILLAHEHSLEQAKKEAAKLKQDLETALAKMNLDALEQKRQQSIIDAEMQKLENEKKQIDMKKKEQEEKLDQEKRSFDERLRIVRDEQDHRLKQESLYWKDFYETRSLVRKDASDFMKFIPGLVVAVGGICAVYLKMSAEKK
jgi:hypothetical protein